MAIADKLNAAWNTNLMEDATFEFRAAAEQCYQVLIETVNRLDAIVARSVFANVDAELKTEGTQVRNIINSAKAALDAHVTFLNWKQP